jgi:hypothetical protein
MGHLFYDYEKGDITIVMCILDLFMKISMMTLIVLLNVMIISHNYLLSLRNPNAIAMLEEN